MVQSDLISSVSLGMAFSVTLVMAVAERINGVKTSPLLFAFWSALFVCGIPTFKVQVEELLKNKGHWSVLVKASH